MTFLEAVNRLFRITRIIKGDDDALTDFSDSQHAADLQLAIISIQDELNDLVSNSLIPYEKTSTSFTSVSGQRTYSLASDFIRFYGQKPFLYDSTNNVQLYEYVGGEDNLRHNIYDYKTQTGDPHWWYLDKTTTKKIGLFQVPDANNSGKVYTYDYEKDVTVSVYTDTLPFHTDAEGQAFTSMAAERFKYMRDKVELGLLDDNPSYSNARLRLKGLMKMKNSNRRYGNSYA